MNVFIISKTVPGIKYTIIRKKVGMNGWGNEWEYEW